FTHRITDKQGHRHIVEQVIDLDAMEIWRESVEQWKQGQPETCQVLHYPPEQMDEVWEVFSDLFDSLPEEARFTRDDFPQGMYSSAGYHKHGYIGFFHARPTTEEENEIVVRFAREFDRLYQRFLDLQNAEAQAREAQIQLCLERVRASALAMQSSGDIDEVLSLLFEQYDVLGLEPYSAFRSIIDTPNNRFHLRMTGRRGKKGVREATIRHETVGAWDDIEGRRRRSAKTGYQILEFSGQDLDELFLLLDELQQTFPEDERLRKEDFPNGLYTYEGHHRHGYLGYLQDRPPTDEEIAIVVKFAQEFDAVYQRFLDLEKAEAQAREAQIEAAVERVRAAAMAMHSSDDLPVVVQTLHTQVDLLQVDGFTGAAIVLVDEQDIVSIWDLSDPGGQGVPQNYRWSFDPRQYPVMGEMWQKWKDGEQFFVLESDLEKARAGLEEVRQVSPEFHAVMETSVKQGEYPDQWHAFGSFARGMLEFDFIAPPGVDAQRILTKMTGAFDLAYQRYEDLKQAEAQAREARIEAALERVRAKAMAMHDSDDLTETIELFYHQIGSLTVVPRRCGVALIDRDARLSKVWTVNTKTTGESIDVVGAIRMEGHPVLDQVFEHWLDQKDYFPVLRGQEIKEYYQVLQPQIDFPDYPDDVVQFGHYFMFPEGDVYAWTEEQLQEEDLEIYRRFTSVLS
ncbi:MAG: hypothetical protein R3330_08220, partial [Saprospiraceae bacterium]|nr:hypothetical protein [Saprospiraceae bacterium]